MAEHIANNLFNKNNLDYAAVSRGLNVMLPMRAADNAVDALRLSYDIDLSGHIARQIRTSDIETADIILTMTNGQCDFLKLTNPNFTDKIFVITKYTIDKAFDIDDPYGCGIDDYLRCAEVLHDCIYSCFYH